MIPLLYDKTWIQTDIESKLRNEFEVNLSTSADISYHILPAPHFLFRDSKILVGSGEKKKSIAEIKNFKVFLFQSNFFNKKKLIIKKIIIDNANFSLLRNNFQLINELTNKKFFNKKIKINNSNIFFKDRSEEIISIIKIHKAEPFFDDTKLLNIFNLQGEVFNMPFNFSFKYQNDPMRYSKTDFNTKKLKLNISNESILKKKVISGKNKISFLNSRTNTEYNIKEKLITFMSDNSRLDNSKFTYNGRLSINPFNLDLNINLNDYKILNLFYVNPILIEFIKSGLLFNDNISVNTSLTINSNKKKDIFHNAKINFHIANGILNLNKTKFVNNDIGSLQFNNSNLFFKNEDLIFNSDILINIKNSKNLFSFLNTNKSSRKIFKTVLINLDYNFLSNKVKFNDLKIDNNATNSELLTIINEFSDHNIVMINFNKNRQLLNELFNAYSG